MLLICWFDVLLVVSVWFALICRLVDFIVFSNFDGFVVYMCWFHYLFFFRSFSGFYWIRSCFIDVVDLLVCWCFLLALLNLPVR